MARNLIYNIRKQICYFIMLAMFSMPVTQYAISAPTDTDISKSIKLSAEYLCGIIQPNGRFIYLQHTDPNVKYSKKKYNIVRHAGTLYSLVRYLQFYPDKKVEKKVRLAADYLINEYLMPLPGKKNCYAVLSNPKEMSGPKEIQAKLGASALALVALVPLYEIDHKIINLKRLRGLGNFLLMMQKKDGSSYSKYYPESDRFDGWNSLYYPGEAALGLLKLYSIDKKKKWLQGAKKYLLFLANQRKGSSSIPMDHWSLIATNLLLNDAGSQVTKKEKQLLVHHAFQIVKSIILEQDVTPGSKTFGGFSDSRTCPAATRLEGLIATTGFLKHKALQKLMRTSIKSGLFFLINAQIMDGKFKGAIPRATAPLPVEQNNKTFEKRMGELRIDYNQHVMCAMMEYLLINN